MLDMRTDPRLPSIWTDTEEPQPYINSSGTYRHPQAIDPRRWYPACPGCGRLYYGNVAGCGECVASK